MKLPLTTVMEINLRRLALRHPTPIMLSWRQAESLERRGLVEIISRAWSNGAECRLTVKGEEVADGLD